MYIHNVTTCSLLYVLPVEYFLSAQIEGLLYFLRVTNNFPDLDTAVLELLEVLRANNRLANVSE